MIVRYTETKEIKSVKRIKLSENGENGGNVLVYNYEQVTPVKIIPMSDFLDCLSEVKKR